MAVRGVRGDRWADVVIGQPNFEECSYRVVSQDRVGRIPRGCVVDRANNWLYVCDQQHNRILGCDLSALMALWGLPLTDPIEYDADLVIGQPDFVSSAANGDSNFQNYPTPTPARADRLSTAHETAFSLGEWPTRVQMVFQSGCLYVPDNGNHRVLKFVPPFATDMDASDAWGQPDLVSRNLVEPPTASSLRFSYGGAAGVAFDAAGNMWVTDTDNYRVLRFPYSGGVVSKTADLVLGQVDFTARVVQGGPCTRTATSISFVTNVSGYDEIRDSANGLGQFKVGSTVEVSNSVSNDGSYLILGVVAWGGVLKVALGSLADEGAGANITLDDDNLNCLNRPGALLFGQSGTFDITFDAKSNHPDGASAPSKTWQHTIAAGSNRILVVGISIVSATVTTQTVTYGGQPLTLLRRDVDYSVTTELWYILVPTPGTADIVATFTSSISAIAGATSWQNVDQVTPWGTVTGAIGSNGLPTVDVSSAVGQVVLDVVADGTIYGAGSGQTEQWKVNNYLGGGGSSEAGDASVTMSWTVAGGNWAMTAAALMPYTAVGKLYICDVSNNRILAFTPPFVSNMQGEVFGSGFIEPSGLADDPTNLGHFWVNNSGHAWLELWREADATLISYLGKTNGSGYLGAGAGGIGVDSSGNVFTSADYAVAIFKKGEDIDTPKLVFGSSTGPLYDHHTASKLDTGCQGIAFSADQVIVGDHARLMFWNERKTLYTGQACSGVCSNDGAVSDPTVVPSYNQSTLAVSADMGHLYASEVGGDPLRIWVHNLPLVNGVGSYKQLLKDGGGEIPLLTLEGGWIHQVAPRTWMTGLAAAADGTFLWVAETANHRVFRIRNPLTAPVCDCILGQADKDGCLPNRGGAMGNNTLSSPGGLAVDRFSNLYVSDHSGEGSGNRRLLVFLLSTVPTGNLSTIYGPGADRVFLHHGTVGIGFDSANRMVLGFDPYVSESPGGGRLIAWYYDPLNVPGTLPPGSGTPVPDALGNDYLSWGAVVAFDAEDNLYVADQTRTRVMIYWAPRIVAAGPRRQRAVITDGLDVVKGQLIP